MPTYEYKCGSCNRTFEVRQRITEPPLTTCEVCGGPVHRLISPAPFILKGEGWYVTDYPSEARKKGLSTEKSANSTSETKSDTKSDSKSDKPAATPAKSESGGTSGASSGAASSKSD